MSDMDNITDGKFITTDQNDAESKTEGPLKFWRVKAKDVHYGDNSVGKTIRLNLNAGGGLDKKQKHIWKDKPGPKFIWTPQDSKNTEFTYYIRASNKINGHGLHQIMLSVPQSFEEEYTQITMIDVRHVVN